jgi:hypothetical protein
VICSTDGAGSLALILCKRSRSTIVLSGSHIWSAGHEDDRIYFGRPVGSCRDRWLCQRSRHQDILGAAGTPVLLSIFGWAVWAFARTASACCSAQTLPRRQSPSMGVRPISFRRPKVSAAPADQAPPIPALGQVMRDRRAAVADLIPLYGFWIS